VLFLKATETFSPPPEYHFSSFSLSPYSLLSLSPNFLSQTSSILESDYTTL